MAERDPARVVTEAVQAMRQAQQLLGASAQVVISTIADEAGYAGVWAQMMALPACVDFAPLRSARAWPVDVAQHTQQESPQADAGQRFFTDALLRRARDQRSPAAPSRPALSVVGAGSNLPSLNRTLDRASSEAALDSSRRDLSDAVAFQAQEPRQPSSATGSVVSLGSWAALERIGDLLQDLERHTSREAKALGAGASPARQDASQSAGAPQAQAARAPGAAQGGGGSQLAQQAQHPQVASPVASSLSRSSPQTSQVGGAPSPLEGLVHDWWSKDKTPERSSVRSGRQGADDAALSSLAPRGVSMLEPRITPSPRVSSVSSITPVSAKDSVARGASLDRLADARGQAGEMRLQDDDALAEQLNRALIEQAWRGGVDLT